MRPESRSISWPVRRNGPRALLGGTRSSAGQFAVKGRREPDRPLHCSVFAAPVRCLIAGLLPRPLRLVLRPERAALAEIILCCACCGWGRVRGCGRQVAVERILKPFQHVAFGRLVIGHLDGVRTDSEHLEQPRQLPIGYPRSSVILFAPRPFLVLAKGV